MRGAIADPDGEYVFEDFVDDDGIDRPLASARLVVAGDEVDLSGSSEQAKGPVNCTLNMSDPAVVCGVMMALAGTSSPMRVAGRSDHGTRGLCVNARSPPSSPTAWLWGTGW